MGIKLKKYSHSIVTKIIVFIITVLMFTGMIQAIVEVEIINDGEFSSVVQDDYFQSYAYIKESENLINDLTVLVGKYKNEENILSGQSIDQDEWSEVEERIYIDFRYESGKYNHELSEEKNRAIFEEAYAEEISQAKDRLIKEDLRYYHKLLQRIETYEVPYYYASDGTNTFSNHTKIEKEQLETYPAYMIFEGYKSEIYPKETNENENLRRITEQLESVDPNSSTVYIAFTENYLNQKTTQWEDNKAIASKNLKRLIVFLIGFVLSFVYLVLIIGRKSFNDEELHLRPFNRLYNDVNLFIFFSLFPLWITFIEDVFEHVIKAIPLITIPFASIGLLLILSLVKHIKNRTLFKHTLIFTVINKIASFVGDVYRSGSVAVKTVLIVIGYPILIAATFFMFPVTIGVAAWFAFKKVKKFQAIQDGVEKIKDGNLHHRLEVAEKGEFGELASNINSITDGLKKAVDQELKSERLKTELITNVSHDIRTPLTSIITYVDLLKKEENTPKAEEYIEVLDQKSKRLKVLTDDLFEATKASSGNIPVTLEKIDVVSLLKQGLGEVSHKLEEAELDFKLHVPNEKLLITADGKLLWRSIENVLSNIFKYALRGSRVYISIDDEGEEVLLTFKNISAYELNISADELMERFKRGDESRSSQGSGLGLSIAKSLIEVQKGTFTIQIDGDLFKAMIHLPK